MIVLDGKETAELVREEIKAEVATLAAKAGRAPGLTVMLVGDDPASQVYVRNKGIACEKAGINSQGSEINKPEGKIRLVYEANPLAYIVEQAGGMAISGDERILDIKPRKIHQTSPIIFGSKNNVKEFLKFFKGGK